jgi:hypothetical protein
MTLKEKFWELNQKQKNLELAQECEKIADEFAIGFGEFMLTKIFVKKSVKELLEIYKKKKGL